MLVVSGKPPDLVMTCAYSIAILLGFLSYRGYFRSTRIVPCAELQVLDSGLPIRNADFPYMLTSHSEFILASQGALLKLC